jgi:hypothetical protein
MNETEFFVLMFFVVLIGLCCCCMGCYDWRGEIKGRGEIKAKAITIHVNLPSV